MFLPRWFLIINDLSLLALGLTLLWVRLRGLRADADATAAEDPPDVTPSLPALRRARVARVGMPATLQNSRIWFGLLWALLCCAVGVGLLLMAMGRLAQPGSPARSGQASGHRAGPEFPTDR